MQVKETVEAIENLKRKLDNALKYLANHGETKDIELVHEVMGSDCNHALSLIRCVLGTAAN